MSSALTNVASYFLGMRKCNFTTGFCATAKSWALVPTQLLYAISVIYIVKFICNLYGETQPKKKCYCQVNRQMFDTKTGEGMEMSNRQSDTAPWASTGLGDMIKLPKGSLFIINVWETRNTALPLFLLNSDHILCTPVLI